MANRFLQSALRDFHNEGLETYDIMLILAHSWKLAQGFCRDRAMIAAAMIEADATLELFFNPSGDPS